MGTVIRDDHGNILDQAEIELEKHLWRKAAAKAKPAAPPDADKAAAEPLPTQALHPKQPRYGFSAGLICLSMLALLVLPACSTPNSITLQSALVQTEDALAAARLEARRVGPAGYYPCKLTATFSVQGQAGGTLGASVLGSKLGLSVSGSSGNTVVVELESAACGAKTDVPPVMLMRRRR